MLDDVVRVMRGLTEEVGYTNPWHDSKILFANDSLFHFFIVQINRL